MTLEDAAAEYLARAAPPLRAEAVSLVALENVSKTYGSRVALHPVTPRVRRRPHDRADRPERLRQVDAAAHDRRAWSSPTPGASSIDGDALTPRQRRARAARDRLRHPGRRAVSASHRARRTWRCSRATSAGTRRRSRERVRALADAGRAFRADALARYPQQLSGRPAPARRPHARAHARSAAAAARRAARRARPGDALRAPGGAQGDLRALAKTVVMVTHDMGEAAYFADEIVMMRDGRIVQRGTIDDLLERPAEPYVSAFVRAQRVPLRDGARMMRASLLLCLLAAGARAARRRSTSAPSASPSRTSSARSSRRRCARAGEAAVTHQQGLGNTAIVFAALKSGAIDLYPEYTGTIAFELLQPQAAPPTSTSCSARSRAHGLGVGGPARLQQHLRDRHVGEARARELGDHAHLRPRAPPGAEARPVAGVPESQGRLARAEERPTRCRRRRAVSITASRTRRSPRARST